MQGSAIHNREEALIYLLDDPSPKVRHAVLTEFERLGGEGLTLLKRVMAREEGEVAEVASEIYARLTNEGGVATLLRMIEEKAWDLEAGSLAISRILDPEAGKGRLGRELDRLAHRCRQLRVLPMQAYEQIKILNRVFFHEEGYRGDIEDYENPENSLLTRVIDRRRGIPISLSVLYLLVGRRLGLELEPVAYPGHFLVGFFDKDRIFYIDAFERGRIRRVEELMERLSMNGLTSEFHFLSPAPVEEVLCRMCRNLERHLSSRGEETSAKQFEALVRAFESQGRGEFS